MSLNEEAGKSRESRSERVADLRRVQNKILELVKNGELKGTELMNKEIRQRIIQSVNAVSIDDFMSDALDRSHADRYMYLEREEQLIGYFHSRVRAEVVPYALNDDVQNHALSVFLTYILASR